MGQVTSGESEFLSMGRGDVSPPVGEQGGGMVVGVDDPYSPSRLGCSRLPGKGITGQLCPDPQPTWPWRRGSIASVIVHAGPGGGLRTEGQIQTSSGLLMRFSRAGVTTLV